MDNSVYGLTYFSEGVAEHVLSLFPKDFKGVCVDVGAYDPFWTSNSWILEEDGWETYCIEPNPNCIPRLKEYRKNVLEFACGEENKNDVPFYIYTYNYAGPNLNKEDIWYGEAAATGLLLHKEYDIHKKITVNVRTLDWLMENIIKQDHIDYISIDVERNEMSVLKGFDLARWKPKVIVIENIDRDTEQLEYLQQRGYKYIYRMSLNDFYMLDEL